LFRDIAECITASADSQKESRLGCLTYPIQFSKNRLRQKGRQLARALSPCQAKCFRAIPSISALIDLKKFRLIRNNYRSPRCTVGGCKERTARKKNLIPRSNSVKDIRSLSVRITTSS